MKNIYVSICAFLLCCMTACKADYDPITENIYISDAENINYKRLTIDDEGGNTSFSVRLSSPAPTQIKAKVAVDESVLDEYNKLNGTSYLPLPEHLFSLSTEEVTIETGKISATPVQIKINSLDESVQEGDKYAIPVRIVEAEGTSLLEASSHLVILLDRVIITNILKSASWDKLTLPDDAVETTNLNNWTVEFLVRPSTFRVNQHIFSISDIDNSSNFFARFGEYDHPVDELQFKVQHIPFYGPTKFQKDVWQHIAITYDGSSYRLYKDGKLDLQVSAESYAGAKYTWKTFQFKATSLSEIRIWSCVRKESEIANNMYAVNPETEHLEMYWKVNEGSGTLIHDYTKHQRHMTARGTWVSGQRFPENME